MLCVPKMYGPMPYALHVYRACLVCFKTVLQIYLEIKFLKLLKHTEAILVCLIRSNIGGFHDVADCGTDLLLLCDKQIVTTFTFK